MKWPRQEEKAPVKAHSQIIEESVLHLSAVNIRAGHARKCSCLKLSVPALRIPDKKRIFAGEINSTESYV
jgi:hypothetical protein